MAGGGASVANQPDPGYVGGMTAEAIEYDDWDKQMVKDFSPGGRGMAWAAQVRRDMAEDRARPMEEVLAEARAKRDQSQSRP